MYNPKGLITLFARHKVAPNLLMGIMILIGLWTLTRINVQFLPSFQTEIVTTTIIWTGASAEDIERSIVIPVETELRDLDNLKRLTSISKSSLATINAEFVQGSDMSKALEDIRERIGRVRSLPQDSEKPIVTRQIPYEPVAKLIVYGPKRMSELRPLVRQFERELLDAGIAKITLVGLPEDEIAIQIPTEHLVDLNLSLPQLAERIARRSMDLPAGTIGKAQVGRQLRSLKQKRTPQAFENLSIATDNPNQLVRLGDIAKISRRAMDREVLAFYEGKPAVEMQLLRTGKNNALQAAKILHNWLEQINPQLGPSAKIKVYDENWLYIQERIDLLLKNGLGGLILIIVILFLFLNRHVAIWVVAGIPASFLAAIAVLGFYGGSINMVSLFALIMSLGIIVDDTIVVGEQALTHLHHNLPVQDAVEQAAYKMLAPIMSSSLTTVCAFLPLLMIGDIIGTILFAIPLVVICVILASLIECFFVLPGHLSHSLKDHNVKQEPAFRQRINIAFARFQHTHYRHFIEATLQHRAMVLSVAFAIFLLSLALVFRGIINFTFFPSPEGRKIQCNIQFTVGTPEKSVLKFLHHVEQTLVETDKALKDKNKPLLVTAISFQNQTAINRDQNNVGEQYASLTAELVSPEERRITNDEFIRAWRKRILLPPGIENFSLFAPRGGPPGEDIDIEFSGTDANQLKQAALAVKTVLRSMQGVSDIRDDLPFGQPQVIFELNQTGETLGLTTFSIGNQLRAAFNGQTAQIFHEPNEEIEVRVMLPDNERNSLTTLEHYPIITPLGHNVPLKTVATLRYRRGPEVLLHTDTKLSVHISAKVDNKVNNANRILERLQEKILPDLKKQYGFTIKLRGKSEEQADTFADMKYGLVLGVSLIYIILAWVFSSYTWPLLVMSVIPLGLTGGILGHLLMGLDLTILSLFGFFGLSGIVINDSIILLNEYRLLRSEQMSVEHAIVEASTRRLRAVLLTSITTIAGLTPILFETSLQAQFLIPMATTISFGLAYATLLILVVIPSLLAIHECKGVK